MKYVNEYRNSELLQKLTEEILKVMDKISYTIHLMEVCGTHTMTIGRFGLRKLLPENIKLISGPGCPVCVTPDSYIDTAISLSQKKDSVITTFGDMVKVPGSCSSLEKEKSEGRDIKIIYSPLEALSFAGKNPDKKIIFLGIGFETTAPAVALTIKNAYEKKIKNFFVLSGHKLIPPAMETLMEDREVKIDGFICPGHVSTIIGKSPYSYISRRYNVSSVIAGFEPTDILEAILILIKNIVKNKSAVEIQYNRVVKAEGNKKARKVMDDVFDVVEVEWRGLGMIKKSGLKIKDKYSEFDVEKMFSVKISKSKNKCGCICGDILKGKKIPTDCKLFGNLCTPESPVGPCMVSSEGTCAAYYRYEK